VTDRGTVTVTWDETHRFAELTFDGVVLESEADVAWLRQELVGHYESFERPFDALICLDGLRLDREAVRAFGEMRADLTNTYFNSSRRYGGGRVVQTAVLTSSVLYDAGRDMFSSRDDAIRDLLESRA